MALPQNVNAIQYYLLKHNHIHDNRLSQKSSSRQIKGMDGFLYWILKQVKMTLLIHGPQNAQTPAQPNNSKYAAANQAN